MAKRRIFVDKLGNVLGLYDEKFGNILDYGTRNIQRASHVEFDNEYQVWGVKIPPDDILNSKIPEKDWPLVATAATREAALAIEKEYVETLFLNRLIAGLHHGEKKTKES